MASTYGENFRVTLEGTSHGPEINVRIDGIPVGTVIDYRELNEFMDRRSARGLKFATDRKEIDVVNWRSGVVNFTGELGLVTEESVEAYVENNDVRPKDYIKFKTIPRPGHADYAAIMKDGKDADISGGGRFSGRLTVGLCIAGGIAKQLLQKKHIEIMTDIVEIGGDENVMDFEDILGAAQGQKDSVGGIIECNVLGLKAGSCGDSYWEGLEGKIAKAIFGIPAVKGVEFGNGFESTKIMGSANNDPFSFDEEGRVITLGNNHGGILGGIATGMPITVRAAIKPTPSIGKEQQSVNLETREIESLVIQGRHDPCIVPRALPCIEAAVAIAILDSLMEEERKSGPKKSKKEKECLDHPLKVEDIDDLKTGRAFIDQVDERIVEALVKRLEAVEIIGEIKEKKNVEIADKKREKEILGKIKKVVPQNYVEESKSVMKHIMNISREKQAEKRKFYGLLGRDLGHSQSPEIHNLIGEKTGFHYEYTLFEKEPEEVEAFIKGEGFKGLNVTMPYKEKVIPYLSELSEEAKTIGAVNTIILKDGKSIGYNTDYFGFIYSLDQSNIQVRGKKALILGKGGGAKSVKQALLDLGAAQVNMISVRDWELSSYNDMEIIVNATPLGMYPNTDISPVDLMDFPKVELVIDLIYNPMRSQLLCQGKQLGLQIVNGMDMLVSQAIYSSMLFTDKLIPNWEGIAQEVANEISWQKENVILIGMPGVGKTTIGKLLGEKTGKEFLDIDQLIEKKTGSSIKKIFNEVGEKGFREIEREVVKGVSRKRDFVISCGGGVVTEPENYFSLAKSGKIILLDRTLDGELDLSQRPISQMHSEETLRAERWNEYLAWSDFQIDGNNKSPDQVVSEILTVLGRN